MRLLILITVALAGCDPNSEQAFTNGRSYDACLETIPACPSAFASCSLDETQYARQTFPGEFRFMVNCEPGEVIEVFMFFSDGRDAGLSTQIFWNEPGCSDVYTYDSDGLNLFEEAGETSLFSEKRTMVEGGEHLIEIFSDMQAEVLVSATVIIPGT